MGDGIVAATNEFRTNHVGSSLPVIILLTDGKPNGGPDPTGPAAGAKEAGIRLITIGLGAAGTDFDPVLLQTLASSLDDYHYASNTAVLEPIYGAIAYSLCRQIVSSPSVTITSPTNGQTLLARTHTTIHAITTNWTAGVTISWVEFFANASNRLGFATSPTNGSYQIDWPPTLGGTNVLTALAVDSLGTSVWSSPVTNYVRNIPAVTITNPINGMVAPLSTTRTNITINATTMPDRATITN